MVPSKQNSCPVSYQTLVDDPALIRRMQKGEHSKEAVHGQTHKTPPGDPDLVILCHIQLQGRSHLTRIKVTMVTPHLRTPVSEESTDTISSLSHSYAKPSAVFLGTVKVTATTRAIFYILFLTEEPKGRLPTSPADNSSSSSILPRQNWL